MTGNRNGLQLPDHRDTNNIYRRLIGNQRFSGNREQLVRPRTSRQLLMLARELASRSLAFTRWNNPDSHPRQPHFIWPIYVPAELRTRRTTYPPNYVPAELRNCSLLLAGTWHLVPALPACWYLPCLPYCNNERRFPWKTAALLPAVCTRDTPKIRKAQPHPSIAAPPAFSAT